MKNFNFYANITEGTVKLRDELKELIDKIINYIRKEIELYEANFGDEKIDYSVHEEEAFNIISDGVSDRLYRKNIIDSELFKSLEENYGRFSLRVLIEKKEDTDYLTGSIEDFSDNAMLIRIKVPLSGKNSYMDSLKDLLKPKDVRHLKSLLYHELSHLEESFIGAKKQMSLSAFNTKKWKKYDENKYYHYLSVPTEIQAFANEIARYILTVMDMKKNDWKNDEKIITIEKIIRNLPSYLEELSKNTFEDMTMVEPEYGFTYDVIKHYLDMSVLDTVRLEINGKKINAFNGKKVFKKLIVYIADHLSTVIERLKENPETYTSEYAVQQWILKMGIRYYEINEDLSVDTTKPVDLSHKNLKEIPVKFRNTVDFYCDDNDLKSFKNFPENMNNSTLSCNYNEIENFEDCPKNIKNLYIKNNNLKNLKDCPSVELLAIEGNEIKQFDKINEKIKIIDFRNNPLKSLKNLPINITDKLVTLIKYYPKFDWKEIADTITDDDIKEFNRGVIQNFNNILDVDRAWVVDYVKYLRTNDKELKEKIIAIGNQKYASAKSTGFSFGGAKNTLRYMPLQFQVFLATITKNI